MMEKDHPISPEDFMKAWKCYREELYGTNEADGIKFDNTERSMKDFVVVDLRTNKEEGKITIEELKSFWVVITNKDNED